MDIATVLGLGRLGTAHLPATRTASTLTDIPVPDLARVHTFMEASISRLANAVCPNYEDALAKQYLAGAPTLPLE